MSQNNTIEQTKTIIKEIRTITINSKMTSQKKLKKLTMIVKFAYMRMILLEINQLAVEARIRIHVDAAMLVLLSQTIRAIVVELLEVEVIIKAIIILNLINQMTNTSLDKILEKWSKITLTTIKNSIKLNLTNNSISSVQEAIDQTIEILIDQEEEVDHLHLDMIKMKDKPTIINNMKVLEAVGDEVVLSTEEAIEVMTTEVMTAEVEDPQEVI